MPLVVSDTSPIRALAHLGHLDLLPQLFRHVLVPPAVVAELDRTPPGFTPLELRSLPYVEIRLPVDRGRVQDLLARLGPGEAEALALAIEVHADAVLIDEAAGRAMAKKLGLLPIGVLGTLLRAKEKRLIPVLAPLLDRLEEEIDFRVSAPLRSEILRRARE